MPLTANAYKPAAANSGAILQNYFRPQESVVDRATKGTKNFLDTLGIPKFSDIFGGGAGGATNFGPGFQGMPTLEAPKRGDFMPEGNDGALTGQRDLNEARRGFNDPTHTDAFQNLMSLASSKTASANEAARDQDRAAAMRRGWAGGQAGNEQMRSRERMKALAEQGFEGVDKVREQELARYTPALEAVSRGAQSREEGRRSAAEQYGQSVQEFNKTKLDAARLPAEYIKTFTDAVGSGGGGLASLFKAMLEGSESDINRPTGPYTVNNATGARRYSMGLPSY